MTGSLKDIMRRRGGQPSGRMAGGKSKNNSTESLPHRDIGDVFPELEIYRIELDLQNDELCRTQDDLIEIKDRYAELFDFAPVGYFATHGDGRILEANLSLAELLGVQRDHLLRLQFNTFVAPSSQDTFFLHVRRVLETKSRQGCEVLLVNQSGARFWARMESIARPERRGGDSRVYTSLTDISEQKVLEEDRLLAARIESLGTIAGGIAHDFNNALMVIQGNAEILRNPKVKTETLGQSVSEIIESCGYAAGLTNQLLTFSKGGAPKKEVIALSEILTTAISLCLSGRKHTCEIDIADDLRPVNVDRCQISQVASNLILNAVQSMTGRGHLIVRARNCWQENNPVLGLPCGAYVTFSVEDQGSGIEPPVLGRIFDPYFTTKKTGSGLGLSVVYSIIKKHNGGIDVDSVVGRGTTFRVYLPAHEEPIVTSSPPSPTMLNLVNGKKVLIMDDDKSVRNVLTRSLRFIGCDVAAAADGETAIRLFQTARDEGAPFDLVLLDLTIVGGKGGLETIGEILKLDENANVVVVSGYSDDDTIACFSEYGFKGSLKKPFSQKELRRTLNAVFSV